MTDNPHRVVRWHSSITLDLLPAVDRLEAVLLHLTTATHEQQSSARCGITSIDSNLSSPAQLQVISPMASVQHGTVLFNDVNTPMTVETPMFSGTALLLLRNLPSTPLGAFEGKRRQMVLTVQVRHLPVSWHTCMVLLAADA